MGGVGADIEAVCREAAIKEIHRRYKFYEKELKKGRESGKTLKRIKNVYFSSLFINSDYDFTDVKIIKYFN